MQRSLIFFEFIVLFVLFPLVASYTDIQLYMVFLPMLIVFLYAAWWVFFHRKMHWKSFWRSDWTKTNTKQLKFIGIRFILTAVLLTGLVWQLFPDKLLNFPLMYPLYFLAFIVVYPVLSVLPQEFLYRTFFFERYHVVFIQPPVMILASSMAFSYLHIIYHNYIAVIFTLVGGYFFAQTYSVTRSLFVACLEHSLYGLLVFTLGFGGFFIRGLKTLGLVL